MGGDKPIRGKMIPKEADYFWLNHVLLDQQNRAILRAMLQAQVQNRPIPTTVS